MRGWLVALDFGTTSTAVAVASGGSAGRAVVFGDGSSTVPSSVFAESDGRLVVGVEADNEAELALDAYEPTPKRRVADGVIRLGGRDFAVAELIGAVLAPVLGEALAQHNNTVPEQVVLTHPVAWRARRRAVLADALKAAAARLGVQLPEPVFVAEPVAAAQWYAHTYPPAPGAYFAVYDLGGGTFDTTVLQATGDGFEVIASGGVDPLGGFDFDAALFDYLGTKYIAPADAGLWAGLSMPGQPDPELARQRRRLQQRVGLLKLGLSTSPDKQIQLPGVTGAVVITRSEYEALIAGQIDNTVGELEDTIADAGLTPDKLTAIYRIGGAARTPLVGAALDRLRVPVKVLDQPKLVVAQGAAALAPTPAPIHATEPDRHTVPATSPPPAESAASPNPPPSIESITPQLTALPSRAETDEDSEPPLDNGESETATTPAWRNRSRLALRVFAIVVLTIVLIGASGAGRGLEMLLGDEGAGIAAVGVALVAIIGTGICRGFKHGPWEALSIISGGIAGLAAFVWLGQASHWVGDVAGYVGLVLLCLTRPSRRPTVANAVRHLGAGLSVVTVTLVMTADYSNKSHLSFPEAFNHGQNADLWIATVTGLALIVIGADYYYHYAITKRETYPTAELRRDIVLVLAAAVFIPLLIIQAILKTHPANQSSAPAFDGTYTKSYGLPAKFDRTPNGGAVSADNQVVARSTCSDDGCVAVDRGLPNGTPQVWDYIDGHWVTVAEYDDDKSCNNTASTEYVAMTLSRQSDGSLSGDQIEEWTAGCYQKTLVAYRRAGGLEGDGQLPDPSAEPPRRNPPPAVGFHGKYRLTLKADNASTPNVENYIVHTHCLRIGERCLSFASTEDGRGFIPLVYQNGSWTGSVASDQTCSEGTDHIVESYNLPLPSNAADPIQTLTGSADFTGSNACYATGSGQADFQRTGD